jgi:hypothetical protein
MKSLSLTQMSAIQGGYNARRCAYAMRMYSYLLSTGANSALLSYFSIMIRQNCYYEGGEN